MKNLLLFGNLNKIITSNLSLRFISSILMETKMKILEKCKDGGINSTVDAYVLIEIKSLFSIIILKFNKGSRNNFHSHAFNAITWFLKGRVTEYHLDGGEKVFKGGLLSLKYTPKTCFHKVYAHEDTYALTIRGSWKKTWSEFNPIKKIFIKLTNGRKVVSVEKQK